MHRLRRMHDRLFAAYGPQHWWPAQTPFEVVIGAYLTQNTSWKVVERSLDNLRAEDALSIHKIRILPLHELTELIRSSGFYTRKAPAIKAFVAMLDTEFGGSLDMMASHPTNKLRQLLLALPSVGPETADAILLYALGHAIPVADEYLRRIVERHKLAELPVASHKRYKVLVDLTRIAFANDGIQQHASLYNEFHALTVMVGKNHCGKTAQCNGCPLEFDLKQ